MRGMEPGRHPTGESRPTTYVVVAARRIQPWIARTPRLALLRGASRLLRDATTPSRVQAALEATLSSLNARVDEAESAVDGVVVVQCADAAHADRIAADLLRHAATAVPGVEWAAWHAQGDSYVQAYGSRAKNPTVAALPAAQTVPFARACEGCRAEAGTEVRQWVDDGQATDVWFGADCLARFKHQAKNADWQVTVNDRELLLAKDFNALAQVGAQPSSAASGDQGRTPGALGRKDSTNHLATICADGNRVGAFFDIVAKAGPEAATFRSTASGLLNSYLRAAVEQSIATLSVDSTAMAIPHFIGGDDILLSTPANRAWELTHHLVLAFEGLKAELSQTLRQEVGHESSTLTAIREAIDGMSLGVGIAFAHASYPFSATQEHAHAAMTVAKRHTLGRMSAVGWLDLTEGTRAEAERVITAHDLGDAMEQTVTGAHRGVLALNPAARAALRQVVAAYPDSADREAAVTGWVKRTRNSEGLDVTLEEVDRLPALLSQARWWPTDPVLPTGLSLDGGGA